MTSELAIVDFWISLSRILYLRKQHYAKIETEIAQKWNKDKINPRDTLWAIANSTTLIQRAAKETSYDKKTLRQQIFAKHSDVLSAMAKFTALHHGNDPTKLLSQSYSEFLQSKLIDPYSKWVRIESTHCCYECESLDDIVRTVKQEVSEQSLPQPVCTNKLETTGFPFCTCIYRSYFKEDTRSYDDIEVEIEYTPSKKKGFWGNIFK